MMTSWRLWSALQNPPALNPIFRRIANVEYTFNFRLPGWLWLRRLGIVCLLAFAVVMLITRPQFVLLFVLIIPMSIFLVLMGMPILITIGSSLLGAFWASVVSTAIVRERERGRYDLLCLLPDGMLGTNWAIGSGCIHRNALFDLLQMGSRTLVFFAIVILGIVLIVTLGMGTSLRAANDDLLRAARTILDMIALTAGYYIHYVQGVVLSPLTGILTAIHVHSQLEARLIAPVIFLTLQIGSYALTFLIAFTILPGAFQSAFQSNSPLLMVLPFAQLAIFCVIREGIFLVVWMMVKQGLNIHPSDFNRLVSLP